MEHFYDINSANWRKDDAKKNKQNALIYLLGDTGLIVLLGGAFGFYNFLYGLTAAFILWIIGGAIGKAVMGVVGSVGFIFLMVGSFHYAPAYVLLGTIIVWVTVVH